MMNRSNNSNNSNKKPKTITEPKARELLTKLEFMYKSNVHYCCGKVAFPISKCICTCADGTDVKVYDWPENQALGVLDPRYKESYDSLSVDQKITEMVNYYSTLVKNVRPHLNFDDPANPNNMPDSIQTFLNWSHGMGQPENELIRLYPKRAALAFNVALAWSAEFAMSEGEDIRFNDAFLGKGGIVDDGKSFEALIWESVLDMLPFSNEKISKFIRDLLLPDDETLALLGPGLFVCVDVCAPIRNWFDENGQLRLAADLEPFDDLKVQRLMETWDEWLLDLKIE